MKGWIQNEWKGITCHFCEQIYKPSTWIGIIWLITAAYYLIWGSNPSNTLAIGITLVGLIEIIRKE